jgi:hypothetical protein
LEMPYSSHAVLDIRVLIVSGIANCARETYKNQQFFRIK